MLAPSGAVHQGSLLVGVGLSASIGLVPRVAVPVVAAAMPIVWLVRTIKHPEVNGRLT